MKVLSLLAHRTGASNKAPRDWSQQEISEFYRAHQLLRQQGVHIGIDRGLTDVGEPWLVYFDERSEEVFMHIARINGSCVLICEHLDLRLKAADIPSLLAAFENQVNGYFRLEAQRKGKIILHPAARIIFSITAVFLLSKSDIVDGAKAAGAEGPQKADADPWTQRKMEAGLQHRLQSIMSSMHDVLDNPTAVAAIASLFLLQDGALKLLFKGDPDAEAASTAKLALSLQQHHDDAQRAEVAAETAKVADDKIVVAEKEHIAAEVAVAHAPQVAAVHAPSMQTAAVVAPVTLKKSMVLQDVSDDVVQTAQRAPQTSDTVVAKETTSIATTQTASTSTTDAADKAPELLAFKALADAIGVATDAVKITAATDFKALFATATIDTVAVDPQGTTTIGTATTTTTTVVASAEPQLFNTSYDMARTAMVLDYFMDHIAVRNVYQVAGELVVRDETALISPQDMAIWSNTMADGSVIKVVGLVDLIDDYGQVAA